MFVAVVWRFVLLCFVFELELAMPFTTLVMNSFTAEADQALGPLALVPCSNDVSVPANKYYN